MTVTAGLARAPARVVFRCDAAVAMGSGHVMRCLTLARALKAEGTECHFICRAHPGHLLDAIRVAGFAFHALPAGETARGSLAHAHWLGASQEEDAAQSLALICGLQPDWLVVDHYALDVVWEQVLRTVSKRLMVIDDLADRVHDAELLLDQNLGRRAEDYLTLVPPHGRVLAGPAFALLRDEFPAARAPSLRRRPSPAVRDLLVSLGGADAQNVTCAVLEALLNCPLPPECRVSVILGLANPWLANVRALARRLPWATEVMVDVPDMARHLCVADLVIGAAGGSAWERCCLGVPSVILVLAANQRAGANALSQAGGALLAESPDNLPELFARLDAVGLASLSARAAEVCDGHGSQRVLEAMKMLPQTFNPETVNDA